MSILDQLDLDDFGLRDFIGLQQELERRVRQRFEKPMALFFTDVVGSTAYIARYGDVAGRALLQRHHELLERAMDLVGGARVVDTAGDGAFCVAPTVTTAARVLIQLQNFILADNSTVASKDRLAVRTGLHWGEALVDKEFVTGESVHTAARIMGTAGDMEIRLSEEAIAKLPPRLVQGCRPLEPQQVKGIPEPIAMYQLEWRPMQRFPTELEVVETGLRFPIPCMDRVTVGRLTLADGAGPDHIVLKHPNPAQIQRVSRRHIALELTPQGYRLRNLSRALAEVDGQSVARDASVRIKPGSTVRLSKVITVRFDVATPLRDPTQNRTMMED